MKFLYLLESIRTPFFDAFFAAITHLGGEVVFMAISVYILWCLNKRTGYYLLCVGFTGTVINQTLKLIFRIPRPWIKDPDFTIVESARDAATGYSFPSGHTQNAIGTFGGLAYSVKKKWLSVLFAVIGVMVAFSRMYLGVHTPLDVGVSFVIALVLVFSLKPIFSAIEKKPSRMYILLGVMIVLSLAYLLYVLTYPFEGIDKDNYRSGLKTAYTLLGALIGVIVGYFIESKYIRYETDAVWWAQMIKAAVGLGIIVLIKSMLKAPLYALFNGNLAADAVRYFIIVMFASCVWPLTFKFFSVLGRRSKISQ